MNKMINPEHRKFWNRDFILLLLAQFLLSVSVYSYLTLGAKYSFVSGSMRGVWGLLAYVVGLPLLGAYTSYGVERKRRNHSCIVSMLILAVAMWFTYREMTDTSKAGSHIMLVVLMFVSGLFSGLSQLILQGTLLIDVITSSDRSKAHKFSLAMTVLSACIAPVFSLMVYERIKLSAYLVFIAVLAVAVFCVLLVRFPFRSPADKVWYFSFDRFFYPKKWVVALLSVLASSIFGYIVSNGILVIFSKSISIVQISVIIIALAVMVVLMMLFQSLFSKHIEHCQRSTVHNSQWLCLEWGLVLGVFLRLLSALY